MFSLRGNYTLRPNQGNHNRLQLYLITHHHILLHINGCSCEGIRSLYQTSLISRQRLPLYHTLVSISTVFPSDELHFLILGVFGGHLMGSIVAFVSTYYTLLHTATHLL